MQRKAAEASMVEEGWQPECAWGALMALGRGFGV